MPHTSDNEVVHKSGSVLTEGPSSDSTVLVARRSLQALRESGLITESHLVRDGVIVYDRSRRNPCVEISVSGENRFFCKTGTDPGSYERIRREIQAYAFLGEQMPTLRRATLEVTLFDSEHAILVLPSAETDPRGVELLCDSRDDATRRRSELGESLRLLHTLPVPQVALFAAQPLWVFLVASGVGSPQGMSAGSRAVVRLVRQTEALDTRVARLNAEWVPSALCHNDLRVENLLALDGRLIIADWESLAIGCPQWDISLLIATALRDALFRSDPRRWELIKIALREVLGGYCARGATGLALTVWIQAMDWVPLALTQAALEVTDQQARVTRSALRLIQAAANWCQRNPSLDSFLDINASVASAAPRTAPTGKNRRFA